jgi:hypothetical protein
VIEPFHELFPDVAKREVRSVHLRDAGERRELPAGEYFFVESYCTNPDCDCEHVMLDVLERKLGVVATISYGFNPSRIPASFDQPDPFLAPSSRQSPYAKEVLLLFKEVVVDEEYNERLRRHYRLVKSAVGASGSSTGRHEGGVPRQRGEWAKQQRKQQKAARRKNRRR